MGRDACLTKYDPGTFISIHAPRMGRDLTEVLYMRKYKLFQSTRPAWGATVFFEDIES